MPLSYTLRKSFGGYEFTKSQEKITHLVYIDDIKLFAKNDKELEILVEKNIQPGYRNGIWHWKMYLAPNEKWNRETTQVIELLNQERIKILGEKENFKFLGILEADTIKHQKCKKKIRKKYFRWTRKLFETKICCSSSRNLIKRNKHLDSPSGKLLRTIHKIDNRRT